MIDLKTAFICIVLVELILALILLLYWKTKKTYPGFLEWTLALFILSIGHAFFALRGNIPDILSIVVANTLVFLNLTLKLDSVNLYFKGYTFHRKNYFICLPLMISLYFFSEYVDNALIRNIIVSTAVIIVMFLTIRVLLTAPGSDEKLFCRLLSVIYAFQLLIVAGRLLEWSVDLVSRDILSPSFFNTIILLVGIMGSIGATLLFLLLNFQNMARELDTSRIKSQDFASRYSLAVSSAKAGIWDIDLKNGDVYWDDSLEKLLDSQVNIEKKLLDIWNSFGIADKLRSNPKEVCADVADDEYLTTEFSQYHRDKSLLHLMVHAKVICDDRDPCRVIGLIYDITPLRKAENALKEAHRKMNLLTSITRHDILNRVNIVNGFANILMEELDDSEMVEMAENISRSGEMITQLISFTSHYQDIGIKDPMWQDISILLQEDEFQSLVEGGSLAFPEPGILIYADEMLEKVLYNLVENSLRHGGNVSSFSFGYDLSSDGLAIIYQDDGIGISEDNKERIFERGYGTNTGMGLFFCREVLEITGLNIHENGVPGKGARFEINVPSDSFREKHTESH